MARTISVAGASVLLMILAILLLFELRLILASLFLGLIVGVSLNPLVDRLRVYRVPRILSVGLVYALLAGILALFVYLAVVQISQSTIDIKIDEIEQVYDDFAAERGLPASTEVGDTLATAARGMVGGVVSQALSLLNALFVLFTILFTGLLFTITQERMRGVGLLFVPPQHRPRVVDVLHRLATGLRRFVIAEIAAMTTVGVIAFIGLTVIGIEFALLLAFVAFITEAMPMIGPWIAFVPAFAVALTQGFWPTVQVCVLYLLIQGVENYIVTPIIHGRGSEIPALLIFVSILIGGSLMGVIGALVALPAAVCLHILFFEVVVPWTRKHVGDPPDELETATEAETF